LRILPSIPAVIQQFFAPSGTIDRDSPTGPISVDIGGIQPIERLKSEDPPVIEWIVPSGGGFGFGSIKHGDGEHSKYVLSDFLSAVSRPSSASLRVPPFSCAPG
jgi:hypothetical protein